MARMKIYRSDFKSLTGKSAGKRPLGRPRRRWEDAIRVDLRNKCQYENYVDCARYRDYWRALVNAGVNLRTS